MTRRHFIQSLAVGVAALALRFRPESQKDLGEEILLSFKGRSSVSAGYVYAKYIPMYATASVDAAICPVWLTRPPLHPAEAMRLNLGHPADTVLAAYHNS